MIDVRLFIKNLGDAAPGFFGAKPEAVKRWLKTGNVPIHAAQKVFNAYQAIAQGGAPPNAPTAQQALVEQGIDPVTKLPINLDRRLPQIGVASGSGLPPVIEMSPTEQSFGVNLTRPGRAPVAQSHPPMKVKDENGQKVAFVEHTPPLSEQRNPDGTPKEAVLPPSIGNDWATTGPPIPQPFKLKPREPSTTQR